ncbi:hypothetical protein CK203_010397 [Vitis vinifera]|uniref:Uncharacterized protein n=1 Tax=Vitis vinifera TaxID=29760 RepID=A0A438JXR7_VITVI|nr:hypothetical protein CK203_010397 [Vitis vinifera]
MLLGARFIDRCCLHRPIVCLSRRFKFSSTAKPQDSHCVDKDCDDFLPWLEQKAGVEISSVLSIGKSTYGRLSTSLATNVSSTIRVMGICLFTKEQKFYGGFGYFVGQIEDACIDNAVLLLNKVSWHRVEESPWTSPRHSMFEMIHIGVLVISLFGSHSADEWSLFASKSIQTGDCILKVPYNVQISPDNVPSKINSLLGDEVGNIAKLAIVISVEWKMGQDSEWAPYINRLPQPGEMHSTRGEHKNYEQWQSQEFHLWGEALEGIKLLD